jgi:hypothetical protein
MSGGLIYLYIVKDSTRVWAPPFRATLPVVVFFFLSNLFLVIAPLIPPESGSYVYVNLPYWVSLDYSGSAGVDMRVLAATRSCFLRSVRARCALLARVDCHITKAWQL